MLLIAIDEAGGQLEARTAPDVLADKFELSASITRRIMHENLHNGNAENHWYNRVRSAVKSLKKKRLVVARERGLWELTQMGKRHVARFRNGHITMEGYALTLEGLGL
jgi:restriction endonuclease Mrr